MHRIISPKTLLGYALGIFITLPFYSCRRIVTGTINCKDIATYTSPYGLLNSIQATVGDVYYINQKDKFVGYIFHEQPDSSHILVDNSINSLMISADINLSTSLDSETPKIKLLSAKVEESLERNTQLKLKNATRVRLNRPYLFLQKIETEQNETFAKLNQDNVLFMVITSVVYSDSLSLETKNNSTNQSGIQTLKIEGITFQLTSNCNDLINVEGKKTGVFFKALFFSYDKNTKKLVPYTQLFDFKNYVVNTVNQ
ncbi:MAG: hypothetical protein LCH91_20470 [Bacteroidetes bacterium]|nr:hypothetical protein [Bacteroidota bacterium]